MRKLIDYFWSFVRKNELKPYEHGPASKFVMPKRDEFGRFITEENRPANLIASDGCCENCTCKDK
jgi:hypothetical protein